MKILSLQEHHQLIASLGGYLQTERGGGDRKDGFNGENFEIFLPLSLHAPVERFAVQSL